MDWQDSVASLYRNFVTINGIMKNRKEQKVGAFKELAGPLFNNLRYDQLKRQREGKTHLFICLHVTHILSNSISSIMDGICSI
jgi:hypothetical protein